MYAHYVMRYVPSMSMVCEGSVSRGHKGDFDSGTYPEVQFSEETTFHMVVAHTLLFVVETSAFC